MLSDRRLRWLLVGCAFFSLVVRAQTATAWPLQNDEAVHLYRSWVLSTQGTYHYTPWTHGPFLYYISAVVLPESGWNFFTARLLTVLLWLPSLISLYWLRNRIGRYTVGVAAILLSLQHYVVWMSTYFRNDIILISILLVWLGLAELYIQTPTVSRGLGLGALGALSIAVKETSFLIAAVLVCTSIVWYLVKYGLSPSPIEDYLIPAVWTIPVSGTAVLLFFFSGVPVTVGGVLSVPLEVIRGPLFWIQPDAIVRTRRGVWWYAQLLWRSPIIFTTGMFGIALAIRSWQPHMLGFAMLFVFFFALHSFVTKQPRRFVLYMIVPLCLLAGYTVTLGLRRVSISERQSTTIITTLVLIAAIVAGVGWPGVLIGTGSPNTVYPEWGLDTGQEEALDVAVAFAAETDCRIHVTDGSLNHQVTRWYLRGENFTHGRWDSNVSIDKKPYIIISADEPDLSYPNKSVSAGGFSITRPERRCSTH